MSSARGTKTQADTAKESESSPDGIAAGLDTSFDKVPNAFALVPGPGVGQWYAVQLKGVTAEQVIHLEPNARPSGAVWGMNRIHSAMDKMYRKRQWGAQ